MPPKLRSCFRDQAFGFGQSRNVSSRTAVRASSMRKSSLPAAASLAICRSQSSSTSSNQLSNSSRSFTESAPAAFFFFLLLPPEIIKTFFFPPPQHLRFCFAYLFSYFWARIFLLRDGGLFYFAMQTFFGSVKKRSASSPPSRPTPLCFMPPKGTRRSRTSQQFTQTVPA